MKRFLQVLVLSAAMVAGAVAAAVPAQARPDNSARVIIQGCQEYVSDNFVNPDPWLHWGPAPDHLFTGWIGGSFRKSNGCSGVRFTGRGTRQNQTDCLQVRLHIVNSDGSFRRTGWVTSCPSGNPVLIISNLGIAVNQRFRFELRSTAPNHRRDTDWPIGVAGPF